MRKRPARTLLFLVYLAVATLACVELLVRASGFAEPHLYDPIYMPFPGTPEIPYVHKPNLVRARGRGLSIVSTDSVGLRSLEAAGRLGPKREDEYRIGFVGDSVTFGEGIPDTADTFVEVVERILNERQKALDVRTFNYGASAYNVEVMTATLRHRMLDIDPDLVVMVLSVDDFVLSRTPAIDPFGYLSDRVPWILPPDSPLRKHMRRVHTLYVIRALVVWLTYGGGALSDRVRRGELPDSYPAVLEFRDIAVQRGLGHLVAFRPSPHTAEAEQLARRMRRDRVVVADFSPIRGEFPPEVARASRFDGHPSAAVHRRFGERLAEELLARGLTARGRAR